MFVEMASWSGTFNKVRNNWKLYGMNSHYILYEKSLESYWIDLRYKWTYAVVIKPCERWLKLLKVFDLIESIDGWVVGGLKLF